MRDELERVRRRYRYWKNILRERRCGGAGRIWIGYRNQNRPGICPAPLQLKAKHGARFKAFGQTRTRDQLWSRNSHLGPRRGSLRRCI